MEEGDRPSSTEATAAAAALLDVDAAAAEQRWAELPEDALDGEIAAYRTGIQDVSSRLQELGVVVSLGEQDGAAADGGEAVEPERTIKASKGRTRALPPSEQGQEGEEDYTLGNVDDLDPSEWQVPPHCIPIHANVTTYDWSALIQATQFDVIMMDPPWQLATANPTRGVALGYSQLTDNDILDLPVPQLQAAGFLFIWVINAKYKFTLDLFERWGYTLVDEVVWVKMTVNRRLAKSHGYYLQHAKEVCLVGKKGPDPPRMQGCVGSDVIYTERRGQSQKPEEIYQLIEELVPGGRYLEIFGRKNNLHDHWVTIGNEVTGTGLPEEDVAWLKDHTRVPNAVYGRISCRGS